MLMKYALTRKEELYRNVEALLRVEIKDHKIVEFMKDLGYPEHETKISIFKLREGV